MDKAFTLPERDIRYINDLLIRHGMDIYATASRFAAMISANNDFYSQIRLLNVHGYEMVRVDLVMEARKLRQMNSYRTSQTAIIFSVYNS